MSSQGKLLPSASADMCERSVSAEPTRRERTRWPPGRQQQQQQTVRIIIPVDESGMKMESLVFPREGRPPWRPRLPPETSFVPV